MNVFSKLLSPEVAIQNECSQAFHKWTPFCSEAALDVGFNTFKEALKMYSFLYLVLLIIRQKYDSSAAKEVVKNSLRSSFFLAFNSFSACLFICISRQLTGSFYYTICNKVPGFLSSFLALNIESQKRRSLLAFYVMNVASSNSKLFKQNRFNEMIIFMTIMPALLYMFVKDYNNQDFLGQFLTLVLGKEELFMRSELTIKPKKVTHVKQMDNLSIYLPCSSEFSNLSLYDKFFLYKLISKSHQTCPHSSSCLSYILHGFGKAFTIGWLSSQMMAILSKLFQIYSNPKLLYKTLSSSSSQRFALFLATYTSIFKLINCLLRWSNGNKSDWHVAVAAVFSSPSILIYPGSSILRHLFWKLIKSAYSCFIETNTVVNSNLIISVLYAWACNQLFCCAVFEPEKLSPSYLNFLNKVTGNRINQFDHEALSHLITLRDQYKR